MVNRKCDVPYDGCDEDKINSSSPVVNIDMLKEYVFYQKERTNIYKQKNVLGLKPPYTKDEILLNYRFTNTRRELDKESIYLINNVLKSKISLEDKLLNCILFRFINRGDIYDMYGGKIEFSKYKSKEELYKMLDDAKEWHAKSGLPKNGNAYLTSGSRRGIYIKLEKEFGSVEKENNTLVYWLWKNASDYTDVLKEKTIYGMYKKMLKLVGLSNFIAYQVLIDLTYTNENEFPFSENEFVISGPGCDRGIEHFVIDKDGLTNDEFMFWLRDNIDRLCSENDIDWNPQEMFEFLNEDSRNWGVMQIENSFCEFDKYIRTKYNGKRPKNKYNGQGEKLF